MLSSVLDLSEDRFLTTLSSQSSTGSTHLQLPTSPEVVSEQLAGANALSEQDTTSSSEGIVEFLSCNHYLPFLWQVYEIYLGSSKYGNFLVYHLAPKFTV